MVVTTRATRPSKRSPPSSPARGGTRSTWSGSTGSPKDWSAAPPASAPRRSSSPWIFRTSASSGAAIPHRSARKQHLVNAGAHIPPGASIEEITGRHGAGPAIDLDTIAWLRDISGLPVIVKGVLRGDDAAACLDAGAAGVVVSNHGGRQLDRAIASAVALPEIVSRSRRTAPRCSWTAAS